MELSKISQLEELLSYCSQLDLKIRYDQKNHYFTQGFYSTVTSPSDRINPGKNPVLWWSKASFWQFQNGNCSVYTSDQHHTEQHLIMSFRVLNEKEAA